MFYDEVSPITGFSVIRVAYTAVALLWSITSDEHGCGAAIGNENRGFGGLKSFVQ
jgi:hypothetical protein